MAQLSRSTFPHKNRQPPPCGRRRRPPGGLPPGGCNYVFNIRESNQRRDFFLQLCIQYVLNSRPPRRRPCRPERAARPPPNVPQSPPPSPPASQPASQRVPGRAPCNEWHFVTPAWRHDAAGITMLSMIIITMVIMIIIAIITMIIIMISIVTIW